MKDLPWVLGGAFALMFTLVGGLFLVSSAAGFVGKGGGTTASSETAAAPNCDGLKGVPDVWPDYFCGAAEKENVDPAFVAAIIFYENRAFVKNPLKHDWPCSSAAACGPAQFIPGTWAAYKTDGKKYNPGDGGGDGKADINAVSDAVFASAKLHKANKAKPKMNENDVRISAQLYNCGCDHSNFAETADYVRGVTKKWRELGGGS